MSRGTVVFQFLQSHSYVKCNLNSNDCYNKHVCMHTCTIVHIIHSAHYTQSPSHHHTCTHHTHTSHPIMFPPHNECGSDNFGTQRPHKFLVLIPIQQVFLDCSMHENTRSALSFSV